MLFIVRLCGRMHLVPFTVRPCGSMHLPVTVHQASPAMSASLTPLDLLTGQAPYQLQGGCSHRSYHRPTWWSNPEKIMVGIPFIPLTPRITIVTDAFLLDMDDHLETTLLGVPGSHKMPDYI